MTVPAHQLMPALLAVINAHMEAEPRAYKVRGRRAWRAHVCLRRLLRPPAVLARSCVMAMQAPLSLCHTHHAVARVTHLVSHIHTRAIAQIIVFFPTARAAQFHAALARASGIPQPCLDLHSRLSQKQRDTAAATFGNNATAVMFASDVIARGLDFPDVSLVVQVRWCVTRRASAAAAAAKQRARARVRAPTAGRHTHSTGSAAERAPPCAPVLTAGWPHRPDAV
jgi:hypothetical protein